MIFFNKSSLRILSYSKSFFLFSSTLKVTEMASYDLIIERLKLYVKKSQQLQKLLIDISLGQSKAVVNQQKTRIQINKMAPLVSLYQEINSVAKNIQDFKQMRAQTKEKQEQDYIDSEVQKLFKKQQQLKQQSIKQLIPPDLYDDCQEVMLQFRSGAGGSQSSLFVEDLSNMIFNYCESMGWSTQIVSAVKDGNINRGFRTLVAKLQGPQVYKIMKCQSGVHKVIRIPETQAKGRIHSSTVSLVVMPSVPFDFSVSEKDIRYDYMRASGPGGQSVNKTESACRATHIPTGMSVMIQQDRSQDRNRKRATQILKQRLFQIEYKKSIQQETKKRKSQMGNMDRSEKIRTYNFPQDRITDHRTGLTLFGMESMMSGGYLERFIEEYQEKIFQQKLECLLEDLKNSSKNPV